MNTQAPSPLHLLRRWLTLLLTVVLAIGPFLHGHFGASHETGFHVDGVHAVHTSPSSTAASPAALSPASWQMNDEESLALGVAASLPHSEDEGLPWLALAWLLVALPLLPPLGPALPRAVRARRTPTTLYRAGLPPPCLAPPAA